MKYTGRPFGDLDSATSAWRRRQDAIARARREDIAAERRSSRPAPYRRDRSRITPEA